MRIVLREKKKLMEEKTRPETFKMKASDFLGLTTDKELYADIKKNIERGGYFDGKEFDRSKVGKLYLTFNKSGKVVGHEGRHRSMAAIKAEGPNAEMTVDVFSDTDDFFVPDTLIGQYDSSFKIDTDSQMEFVEESESNILNIDERWGTKFSEPNMERKVHIFFNRKYENSAMDTEDFLDLVNRSYSMENYNGDMLALGFEKEFFLSNDDGIETNYAYIKLRKK